MIKLLMLFTTLLLSAGSIRYSQETSCPTVPDGLANVKDLQWAEYGVRVNAYLDRESSNPVLESHIVWNIDASEFQTETRENAAGTLRFVDRANLEDSFFSPWSNFYLEMSPSEEYVLVALSSPLALTLYSINTATLTRIELGTITANTSTLHVMWHGENQAVVISTPIYGEGYYLYDVCLEGSCFVDLNHLLGYPSEYPAISPDNELLASYVASHRMMNLVDLESEEVQRQIVVQNRLLPNVGANWSQDGTMLYYLGFDESLGNINVYQLNLETEEEELISALAPNISSASSWLIHPEGRRIIVTDGNSTYITCY